MTQDFENNGNGNEMENFEGATITTRAPKAIEKGHKPENWSMTMADPTAGLSLDELKEKYGEERILELARANFYIRFQAAIRSMAEAGKTDEEIQETMKTWKPGDKVLDGTKDPKSNILKNFGNMTPEQRAEVMALLKSMASDS